MSRAFGPLGRGGATLVAAGLLFAGASARGQAVPPSDSHWTLDDAHSGFCVWYLVEPVAAQRLVSGGTVLVPATSAHGLPHGITEIVRNEPKFGKWIPAVLCVGFYGSVEIDGKVIARGKPPRGVTVLTSAIAAQSPRQVAGADYYLIELASDQRPIARTAENIGFDVGDVAISTHDRGPGADQDLIVHFGGADIVWNGHPFGADSVGRTRSMSFGYAGRQTTNWSMSLESTPAKSQLLIGALRVDGRGDLAKALQASPDRVLTSADVGGSMQLTFHRATKK